jgi:hypothetical protein
MLINGPASGQPGRDAEIFRQATLRPIDERSFCHPAESDAEAFKTAPIGLPDGQKPGSPAGAWIYEGNVDIIADIIFPVDIKDGIRKVVAEFYDKMEEAITSYRYIRLLK